MDRDLVIRARGGDHHAFAALVAARLGKLNAVARLILRDETLAEDAVQDALVDAWRDLAALRDLDKFDAWLRRLLVHSCYSLARRQSRHRIREVELPEDGPATTDSERSIGQADELQRGLRKLPIEHRSLLVLVYYLDLPLNEAAEVLNIPVGTAKSRHHRALAGMRAALEASRRETPVAREGVA
jgi:RNA polymerase sigma-70 factor (ECF subfamily)